MESLVQSVLSNAVAVTVLAVLIAIMARICRRPAWIHSLCLLAMLKLVTPPLVPLAVPVPSSWWTPASPVPAPILEKPGTAELEFDPELDLIAAGVLADLDDIMEGEPLAERPEAVRSEAVVPPAAWPWESWIMGLVLAGALAWWSLAAVRIVRFHRVLRDVEPMPADWQTQLTDLAGRLALRRCPQSAWCRVRFRRCSGPSGPALGCCCHHGSGRPWARTQRAALVLHELAHLKRRDHWVRWFELLIAGLYWWHPAVWWIRRALREAEEQCCDAWVVWAMPRGARTYATALMAALEYVSGTRTRTVPVVAASATIGNGHVSCMKRRLRMIVRAKTPQRLSLAGRLAIVAFAALLLPLAPSWGQKDSSEKSLAPLSRAVRDAGLENRLELELANLDREIVGKKNKLKMLVAKGHVEPERSRPGVTEEQYTQTANEQLHTEMELIENQAMLDAVQSQLEKIQAPQAQEKLVDQVQEEFLKDPEVVALAGEMKEAQEDLERIKMVLRNKKDPARIMAEKHLKKLRDQWAMAWEQKRETIEKRLLNEDANRQSQLWKDKIVEIQVNIDKLKRKKTSLAERLENLKIEKAQKNDVLAASMLNQELALLLRLRDVTQLALDENQARPTSSQPRQADKGLEARIADELEKDPEVAALDHQINETKQVLNGMKRVLRNPKADPAAIHFSSRLDELSEKSKSLRSSKRDALLARFTADDDKDDKTKSDDGREAAERIEKQLKDLVEKLGKDVSPVKNEVRKALERAVNEIHQSLQKEGLTPDDLRRAMEKSREELRRSFQRGGPVEKEMREAAERARNEMREAMERGRQEAERVREEMRRQMAELNKHHREMVEDARDRQRQMGEEAKKGARRNRAEEEREEIKARDRQLEAMPKDARDRRRQSIEEAKERQGKAAEERRERTRQLAESRKGRQARPERPKAEARREAAEKAGDRSNRQELDAVRQHIRELQEQLASATRRLAELQSRESRRPETSRRAAEPAKPARPSEPRRPETPRRPAEPAKSARPAEPAKPAPPAEPARSARPAEPRRPETPARPAPGASPRERPARPRPRRERGPAPRPRRENEPALERARGAQASESGPGLGAGLVSPPRLMRGPRVDPSRPSRVFRARFLE